MIVQSKLFYLESWQISDIPKLINFDVEVCILCPFNKFSRLSFRTHRLWLFFLSQARRSIFSYFNCCVKAWLLMEQLDAFSRICVHDVMQEVDWFHVFFTIFMWQVGLLIHLLVQTSFISQSLILILFERVSWACSYKNEAVLFILAMVWNLIGKFLAWL